MGNLDDDAYQQARQAWRDSPWRGGVGNLGWDCYWFESERRLELYFKDKQPPQLDATIDFQPTPAADIRINLRSRSGTPLSGPVGATQVKTQIGRETQVIALTTSEQFRLLSFDVEQTDGSATVQADSFPTTGRAAPALSVNAPASTEFRFSDVDVHLGSSRVAQQFEHVVATDSVVSVSMFSQVERLHVVGHCQLKSTAAVGTLLVEPGSSVLLGSSDARNRNHVTVRAGELRMARAADGLEPFSLHGLGELVARDAKNVVVRLSSADTTFSFTEGRNLQVTGLGVVKVRKEAVGLSFPDPKSAESLRLEAETWAVMHDVSGAVRLGNVRHAEINGALDDSGLEIHSIVQDEAGKATDGLLLRNFRVPVKPSGLQSIRALAETSAVAIPTIHPGLPGDSWPTSIMQLLARRTQDEERPSTHFRADYARAIARLAETGGAPGSTVTGLAWREYRMRQATAKGPVEWATLGVYRGLGYGERAIPAFIAYAALAVTFSAVALHSHGSASLDLSRSGIVHFAASLGDWLISPLHVLRLGSPEGEDATDNPWEFLGRVLLAIPFLTGVLALRKYVKRTRE